MINPILEHSKTVWQEVHKGCKISQYNQKYAPIWHNPKIKIDRQTVCWAKWFRKNIRTIYDLFENGNFLSYIRFKEKFHLEGGGHFWKYLQIRHCIKEVVPAGQDKGPVECYLQLPKMHHKASKWYEMCPWKNSNGCSNLNRIWEKDLSCTLDEKTWEGILSNTEKYKRDARGKFIQYKIINRYYFTPSRLNRMGLLNNDLCWKCGEKKWHIYTCIMGMFQDLPLVGKCNSLYEEMAEL